jgi:hypothetical protein
VAWREEPLFVYSTLTRDSCRPLAPFPILFLFFFFIFKKPFPSSSRPLMHFPHPSYTMPFTSNLDVPSGCLGEVFVVPLPLCRRSSSGSRRGLPPRPLYPHAICTSTRNIDASSGGLGGSVRSPPLFLPPPPIIVTGLEALFWRAASDRVTDARSAEVWVEDKRLVLWPC